MRKLICYVALLAGFVVAVPAMAGDYVIITNKANANEVDKSVVARIYKGEAKSWANGDSVVAYDLPEDNPARVAFDQDVAGKSISQMKALWGQLVFSGKAVPPKKAESDDEVKKAVASNKAAVGYISAASADGSVKVVK
ncbi:MAG: substrate-binding domain-containing protein [Nitrosomonadales bacterium]|nr:substrate-binding domain-containing protein [Nitrosomonadales bacterium]